MRWIWLLMTCMVGSRPKYRTGLFFELFRCSNDFITQKVYFSRLMRVHVGLKMLGAYFCHPNNHKWSIVVH
jgi:hypothetical protein